MTEAQKAAVKKCLEDLKALTHTREDYDTEMDHSKADRLLCALLTELTGSEEIADAFRDVDRWYS